MNAKVANTAPKAASATSVASNKILQRQCACGNHTTSGQECSTCASKKLQRKLSIGSTNDPLELEADRVADQVMAYQAAHSFSNTSAPKIQRRADASIEAATETGTAPASVERVLERSGSPLPASSRKEMEQRFGYDFSQVRIHTDKEAQNSAAEVNANAYTQKNNIVFGSGYFAPETIQGKKLLAHELTHVVQQSAADKLASADIGASAPGITQAAPLQISRSSTPQLRRMTSKEAQKKLWGLVPDIVKPYAKPIALQARDAIETVIPPTTELPKAVEAVVEKAASVAPIINPPTPAPAAKTEAKPAAPAPKKPSAGSWISGATKEKVRDKAMENLGTVKGVMLEATNIVDSLIWVSHAGNELAEGGIDKVSSYMGASEESRQDALKVYRTVFSQYAAIQEQAKKNGWIDEVTGAVAVSGKFSKAFDGAAEDLEQKAFGDLPKEQATIFTNYELGELKGAVGSQVALAYVGVEEVQLVLKGLGVIGAVKSIVSSVQQNPTGWKTDPNFWVAILNAALTVVGLRQTKAAARLSRFLIAAGSLGNAIPIILNLAKHYSDPQLDADPEKKRKLLAQDYNALIRVVADAITAAIQHASAQKKAGGKPALPLDESNFQAAKPAPVMKPALDVAPAVHPTEPVKNAAPLNDATPVKNTAAPVLVEPVATTSVKAIEPPAATKTKPASPAPGEVEPHKIADTTAEGSPAKSSGTSVKDSDAPAGKPLPAADNDAAVTSIIKEQAIAEKPVKLANGEQHEAVVTNKGIGLCSPGPCPVIHAEYRKELGDFPSLNEWHEKIKVMRKEGKHEQAATEAAQLIRALDAVRNNALKPKVPTDNTGKGMTVETSEAKTPQEKQAAKDFKKITQQELNDLIDKAFSDPGKSGAKIDAEGVTDKTINSKSDRTRHLDVEGPKDAQGRPLNPGQVLTVAEAQQAKKVLGKTITASETGAAVKDAWNQARAEVEKNHGPLTKENYGDLYNKTRDKFWGNVQGSEAAKKFFTDGGFSFDEGRAPMLAASSDKNLRPSQSRVSLDHLEPKATGENWKYALDGENLMFVMQADNTKLQHIESTKPSLKR